MKYDFITIGGTTRDISFFTNQGVLVDNKKDILRQKLLGFEYGAKIKVDKFNYAFGGGAANAAVCLANFGFKTACLANVGADENGRLIIDNLKAHGVDTGLIRKVKTAESGSSFILVTPGGERIIFGARGANTRLEINSQDKRALKNSKNIYIASLAGAWQKNLKQIFSLPENHKAKIFWNPGLTQYLGGVKKIAPFLKKVTVLSSNKDEALTLILSSEKHNHLSAGFLNDPENLVRILHSFGPKVAVITLGSEGVIAYDGQKIYRHSIIKAKKQVDTTGVGDIFNSSFAAAFVFYQGNIDKALKLGMKNTSAKISHLGAQNGLLKLRLTK